MTHGKPRQIPDLFIEKWLKGEATPLQMELINSLPEDQRAKLRADYAARDEAFLKAHPFPGLKETIPSRHRPTKWMMGTLALAACLILTFTVVMPRMSVDQKADLILTKGGHTHLTVYRQTNNGFESLSQNSITHPGDRLQIKYVASGVRYGVVMSIDGRGTVTRHLPLDGLMATRLETKGEAALPTSYQLDDAPGFERFVLVTSSEPFPLTVVQTALESLAGKPSADRATLMLDPIVIKNMEIDSFVVRKDSKAAHD